MHQARHEGNSYPAGRSDHGERRRRSWSESEKARIIAESAAPEANVSDVARRNGVSRGLLTVWRRQARSGRGEDRRRGVRRGARSMTASGGGQRRDDDRRGPTSRTARVVESGVSALRRSGSKSRSPTRGARSGGVNRDVGEGARGAEVDPVISVGREARVFVATEPIDFRTGVHGLVAKVARSSMAILTAATFSCSGASAPTD